MIRTRGLPAAGALLVAAATAAVAVATGATHAHAAAPATPVSTGTVERGTLATMVSGYGTLGYRARANGSPFVVVNRARGTYTRLPESGAEIGCGDVLYRVDDEPVLLLCGTTPAYRSLSKGAEGPDVAALNANLVRLGYATRGRLAPSSRSFTSATASALEKLQAKTGADETGTLRLGQAVFLPGRLRVAAVTSEPGAIAGPGARVLSATTGILEVQLSLDASEQGEVKVGDRVQVTLPGNRSTTGAVSRLGRVAQVAAGRNAAGATIAAYVGLDHPGQAHGLDRAPVQVSITTRGVEDALSVPVTAVVGRAGGGFAVEVVREGGRRVLVSVRLGLFDSAGGRVQVSGDLRAGERVVVPSP